LVDFLNNSILDGLMVLIPLIKNLPKPPRIFLREISKTLAWNNYMLYWFKPGFSTFWVLAYPKIKIVTLWVPPKSELYCLCKHPYKNYSQISFFWVVFINFAYPLRTSHLHPGVRVPQVENRWINRLILNYPF
jgi:hypothetical protein